MPTKRKTTSENKEPRPARKSPAQPPQDARDQNSTSPSHRLTVSPSHPPTPSPTPKFSADSPRTEIFIGDCRKVIAALTPTHAGAVDLIFADPPFNWNRAYDKWDDSMKDDEYLAFTRDWLDACITMLSPSGSFWVNIPDDWAAEIVVHLKSRHLHMINWCIWHYRFGQNTTSRFINSKVHALYFAKSKDRVWNPDAVLEPSDRATTYFDPRTLDKKDGMPAGKRVPMDVWYGQYWGRIQGNNKERRAFHDNQLPEVYLERVIRACSTEGQLVMDPFLGSGTTGVMARALNRRFLGIEFSADNAKSSFQRILAGPTRPLGEALSASSAIFNARKAGSSTRAKFDLFPDADPADSSPNAAPSSTAAPSSSERSKAPPLFETVVRNGKRLARKDPD
jgi:site-specific DNA-methyltransferase (adenine-specific)